MSKNKSNSKKSAGGKSLNQKKDSEEIDTEQGVKCEKCEKNSALSAKNQHSKSAHEGRRFICSECNDDFASNFAYLRHIERTHPDSKPINTKENEVFVSHKVEMSETAKNALIDRLKKELEDKNKIIEEYEMKFKDLENKLKRMNLETKTVRSEIGVKAVNDWIQMSSEAKYSLEGKLLEADFLLSFNPDEINALISLFVKNIRKPDGSEYAPDTVFYFLLGIQKYFLQNCKYINILFDQSCKKISDSLNQVVSKSVVAYLNSDSIQSRVLENYLWECCYLGAYSPEILLATLIYFNIKIFQLDFEDQKEMKFSDIKSSSDTSIHSLQYKNRVYQQAVGVVSGFRCPVKYYQYYLMKCSAAAKVNNNVFLLSPIPECHPDDKMWFSEDPMDENELEKIINRSKLIGDAIASERSNH